jgi:hypothetical protein
MDLSLELQGCHSVAQALDRFSAVEKLDGANKYRWVWEGGGLLSTSRHRGEKQAQQRYECV